MTDKSGDSEKQNSTSVGGSMPSGFASKFFMAPWDGRRDASGDLVGPGLITTTTLVAILLEFFWSFVLGFAVVASRAYVHLGIVGGGTASIQDGFFIGATHASIWLLAWVWATDYNLKRHLNWAITIGHLFKFSAQKRGEEGIQGPDYGVLAFIFYSGMQFAGAALAGCLLSAFSLGNVPLPSALDISITQVLVPGDAFGGALAVSNVPVALAGAALDAATPGLVWFIEFIGVFVIVLANIYNDERHQDKSNNGGNARENEYDNHMRTGVITALTILAMTTALYPLGSYSFGNVPYFAGLIGIGIDAVASDDGAGVLTYVANPLGTRLIDWAHYLFTPLAAGFAGGIAAFFISFLLSVTASKPMVMGEDTMMQVRLYNRQKYRSAQSPLAQQLLANKRPTAGLVRNRAPLTVNAFN